MPKICMMKTIMLVTIIQDRCLSQMWRSLSLFGFHRDTPNCYNHKQQTILLNKDLPFVSDDLFHSIIDLNNIECKEYSKDKSVFNPEFNSNRPRILEDNMNYDLN